MNPDNATAAPPVRRTTTLLLVGSLTIMAATAVSPSLLTTATALAGDYYSGNARDRFMGLQNSAMGFGGLLYLTAGGLLADLHWRAPFAIYGLALLLLPAVAAWITEPSAVAAVARPQADGDGTHRRRRALLAALFAAAVVNSVVFYVGPTQLPFLLQGLGADAPSRTGLALGMITLFSALTSLGYGRLRSRTGLFGGFALGFGLLGGGFVLVGAAESYAAVLVAMAVAGAGIGTLMPTFSVSAMAIAAAGSRGRVAGGLTASIFLGHFLSPLVSQPLIAATGYAAAFRDVGVVAAAMGLSALAVQLFRSRPAVAPRSRFS